MADEKGKNKVEVKSASKDTQPVKKKSLQFHCSTCSIDSDTNTCPKCECKLIGY